MRFLTWILIIGMGLSLSGATWAIEAAPLTGMAKYKEMVRPTLERWFGEDRTTSWLGPKPESILLPAIPMAKNETTSSDVYKYKENESQFSYFKMPKDQRLKQGLQFVEELYQVTRKTKVQDDELNKWMNVLDQGGTREGIYRAVVQDEVYAAMENYNEPTNEKVASFAKEYMATYLMQTLNEESVKKLNFFSVKRVVLDKTLDMIDVMRKNRSDLDRWYAVLSSNLASQFPNEWTLPIRKNTSRQAQLEWSQSMPTDMIKSEVIIKLHRVFNALANV